MQMLSVDVEIYSEVKLFISPNYSWQIQYFIALHKKNKTADNRLLYQHEL
jgi:hypothetical protein